MWPESSLNEKEDALSQKLQRERHPLSWLQRAATRLRFADGNAKRLVGEDGDGAEPGFDEFGPGGDRKFGAAEAEGVAAVGVQMHLHGDAGLLECDVVDQGFFDGVHVIILCLHQKGWRSITSDANIGIQLQLFFVRPQVARIRATAT